MLYAVKMCTVVVYELLPDNRTSNLRIFIPRDTNRLCGLYSTYKYYPFRPFSNTKKELEQKLTTS